MFTRGVLQRRQSEGKSAAKKPCARVVLPEATQFSRVRRATCPECPMLTARDVGATVRVMSPLLLKTCLPHPALGQAPAGRTAFSIAGSRSTSNFLSSCGA